jgi:hypothetical protein
LASEPAAGLLDRVFEGQVLEGMQRVVVDEDADRPLGREQVRQRVDDVGERMSGRGGDVEAGRVSHQPVCQYSNI